MRIYFTKYTLLKALLYFSFESWFLIYFNFSENSFYKTRSILIFLFLKKVAVSFYFILSSSSETQSLYKELLSKAKERARRSVIRLKWLRLDRAKQLLLTIVCFSPAIQVDYDLSFSEPADSSAALSVPFRLNGKTSITVAMWVQFAHHDEPGVFFTLYNVAWVSYTLFSYKYWSPIKIMLTRI